jgi:hypothetical protein
MTAFVQGEVLVADSDPMRKFWGYVLLFAVRDNASSVHYHPWRGDGALAYIVANTRIELHPPHPDWARHCVAAARSLLAHRSLLGRIAVATRSFLSDCSLLGLILVGRSARRTCGSLVLGVAEHRIEWQVVCWSSGGRCGVEFFRITPIESETAGAAPLTHTGINSEA